MYLATSKASLNKESILTPLVFTFLLQSCKARAISLLNATVSPSLRDDDLNDCDVTLMTHSLDPNGIALRFTNRTIPLY